MALDERNPRRSDDMDDEGLGQKGFDKPSGLEKRRFVPSIEDIEHHAVCRVVEYRADRSDKHHDFSYVSDIPFSRGRQVLLVAVVLCTSFLLKIIVRMV